MIWTYQHLGYTLACDTETTIAPFTDTPDLITFQVYNGEEALFVRREDVARFFEVHDKSIFIFHNAPFDIDVICKHLGDRNYFHDILESDRLRDTLLEYKLLKLAENGFVPGKASLDAVYKEYFNQELDKNEEIRCTFDQYMDTPIESMAKSHQAYALQDAIATYKIYKRMEGDIKKRSPGQRLSEQINLAGALALNRIYKRGVGFDLDAAKLKLEEFDIKLEHLQKILATYGWVRGQKGIKERYDSIIDFLGIDVPTTDSGNYSSKEDDLIPFKGNHFVDTYLEYIHYEKLRTFIIKNNTRRLHPRYNSLVNTGRTSCSNPNAQQLPNKGGIKELFIPKEGHLFVEVDYNALEMATLSQVLFTRFKKSKMRKAINAGKDLHKYAASVGLHKSEEDITKEERQLFKAANFGFGANMSSSTFIQYAKGYGIDLTEEKSAELKKNWTKAYPEIKDFWNVSREETTVTTLTGMVRGNCTYTAYLNTQFQSLAAMGAKIMLYYLDYEGFDVVMFVHDSVVVEVPKDKAEQYKDRIESIMVEAMKQVCPDVEIRVDGDIKERYCK